MEKQTEQQQQNNNSAVGPYTAGHQWRQTHENHSSARRMPMLAGGMSREAVIISTVTTLALCTAGTASDPTAVKTLKWFVRLNGPTGETLPNQ